MSDSAIPIEPPAGGASSSPVASSGLGRLAPMIHWTTWVICGFAVCGLALQPLSVETHFVMCLAALAAMLLMRALPDGRVRRHVFLALGSVVVMRYIYWRLTCTLPSWSDHLGFGFGAILLLAEMYCVAILAVSLLINADSWTAGPIPACTDEMLPTVDVLIPSYNEPEAILAATIAAVAMMDYPEAKRTIWLLDDGGTEQKCADPDPAKAASAKSRRASLQKLCLELGARYLTRAKNEHAKAGNLNNGLKHSDGEVVVVFDADHAPFRSFLRETVGHFLQDPKLFLVQTPHIFLNPDPIEKNLRTFDRMPSENEMFYGVTQRGLDKWNGSFFCGSAALLRRTALLSVGGFAGVTITEDCETALELHARGWTSLYVDKPLIAGLQPETFASFIGQRSRWCQGMFQIMLLKNPAFKRGLTLIQRVAYLSSMMFWFFAVPRMIFTFAPLLHIFFGVKVFVSSIDEAIVYTATYLAANLLLQNYLYGRFRWPWVSEIYEYVQGVFLIKAIASVLISPRKPTFNVTDKGRSLQSNHLSKLAWPYVAIFLLLVAGVATAIYRYLFEPGVTSLMLVVGLWCAFNLAISGAALGVVAERREVRRSPRLIVDRRGTLLLDGKEVDVSIKDASAGGCMVEFENSMRGPGLMVDRIRGLLRIEAADGSGRTASLPATVVRLDLRNGSNICGLAFDARDAAHYRAIAELIYGDPGAIERHVQRRRVHKGVAAGSLQFLFWALCGPIRAGSYLFASRVVETTAEAPSEVPAPHFVGASFVDTATREQALIAECLVQHKQSLERLLQLEEVELREPLQATVCEFDAALKALSRIALQQKPTSVTDSAESMAGAA